MQQIITLVCDESKIDFQIDNEMIISDSLEIIRMNSTIKMEQNVEQVYSKRNDMNIPTTLTYKEARIYEGDIIHIRGEKK